MVITATSYASAACAVKTLLVASKDKDFVFL
jgi:hypothetical protein